MEKKKLQQWRKKKKEEKKKEGEKGKKKKGNWLNNYWHMHTSHTLSSILNLLYMNNLYHILNILWLWQLGSLDFNIAIILRNEKFC